MSFGESSTKRSDAEQNQISSKPAKRHITRVTYQEKMHLAYISARHKLTKTKISGAIMR